MAEKSQVQTLFQDEYETFIGGKFVKLKRTSLTEVDGNIVIVYKKEEI